jgi:glycosyltransferase involved in cell wall biosynthesis
VRGILEVGGLPPPYGGITVHIERLCREGAERGFSIRVADPSPDASAAKRALWGTRIVPLQGPAPAKLAQLLGACRASALVHFHGSALENLWMLGPVAPALGRPYVVSVHSGNFPLRWSAMPAYKRAAIRRLIARADGVVCVSGALRDFIASLLPLPARTIVTPAFIPPAPPSSTHPAIAALRERCEKVVLTSGFPLENYGIESFISAVNEVSERAPIGCVIVLYPTSDPTNPHRYQAEEQRVRAAVSKFAADRARVVVLESLPPEVFSSVQAGCDVFVRNTLSDGDSVALREAGHFGCQIVASNAVARPAGTIEFAAHEPASLAKALAEALADPTRGRIRSAPGNARPILDLYQELLAGDR